MAKPPALHRVPDESEGQDVMGLRANVSRRAGWTKRSFWVFDGSHLELHSDVLGYWIVVDGRRPDYRLGGPYEKVSHAKAAAERLTAAFTETVASLQYDRDVLVANVSVLLREKFG